MIKQFWIWSKALMRTFISPKMETCPVVVLKEQSLRQNTLRKEALTLESLLASPCMTTT